MKTGLNLQPINEPIIKRVMEKYSFTKLSPAINFIIQEYDKLTNDNKKTIQAEASIEVDEKAKIETKTGIDFSSWFIVDNKE